MEADADSFTFPSLSPSLQRLLHAPFDANGPAIVPVWNRWLQNRSDRDYQLLFEHYAPLALIALNIFRRRWMGFFFEDESVYVSDALLALGRFIKTVRDFEPDLFYRNAIRWVKWELIRSQGDRQPGGHCRAHRLYVIRKVRSRLWALLERQPTRDEIAQGLEHVTRYPRYYVPLIDAPQCRPVSIDARREGEKSFDLPDHRAADPSWRMANREVILLAMKGLKKFRHKRILLLVLRGQSATSISRRMGITPQRAWQLVNQILWEARCRADLANYLGIHPDHEPPTKDPNKRHQKLPREDSPRRFAA